MNRKIAAVTMAATLLATLPAIATPGTAVYAAAAPEPLAPAVEASPFDGTFTGIAHGANGTQAPIALTLTQQGDTVDGTVTLGDGVYVKTAFCGGATVPAGTVSSSGQVDPQDPSRVVTTSTFDAYGVPITIAAQGELSADGQSLAVRTKIGVPAFCGAAPVLEGTLDRTA
jgi:hypothetical protein